MSVEKISPEMKAAVGKALRGIRPSPAWDRTFCHKHMDDMLYLLTSTSEMRSAKREHSRDFIESFFKVCSDERLVETYVRAFSEYYDGTAADERYVEHCQRAIVFILKERIYYKLRVEQFQFLQFVLEQRRGLEGDIFGLATRLVVHVHWPKEMSHTGDLFKNTEIADCGIELAIKAFTEQVLFAIEKLKKT